MILDELVDLDEERLTTLEVLTKLKERVVIINLEVLRKKREVVKFYLTCVVIINLEVLRFPRPVNLCGLSKKRLFSFSSLLFLETYSKYQFCNFKIN